MSAVVCGKRSSIFEESPSSPPVSKRNRSSSSSSPGRSFSPPRAATCPDFLAHLIWLFPDMDRQFLEKILEESGNNLDSTIQKLYKLRLTTTNNTSGLPADEDGQCLTKGENADGISPIGDSPTGNNLSVDGAEWVELMVREVLSASNLQDAKARLSQALETLENSIRSVTVAEFLKSFHEENQVLKEQLEARLQENAILKKGVFTQFERQKEFESMGHEFHQLKQLASQYQEQIRTLEIRNYELALHLKLAQQSDPLPGRFNPDVF